MSPISALGFDHAWSQAVAVALIVLAAYAATMWIAAVLWTYNDISSRTRDGRAHIIAVAFVAIFSLPGLLLYLLLRPTETIEERAEIQIELDAFAREAAERHFCPGCRRPVEREFLVCPYCARQLSVSCASCRRNLADAWNLCPYCLQERDAAPTARRARRSWRRAPAGAPVGASAPAVAAARLDA